MKVIKIVTGIVVVILILGFISSQNKKKNGGNNGDNGGNNPPPSLPVSGSCPGTFNVGYKVQTISGKSVAIWYPSADSEKSIKYTSDFSGSVAKDGALRTDCGKFPLVIFSHGYAGCSLQSVFFTEQLARNGYIVAAPDHNDASCSAAGGTASLNFGNEPSMFESQKWTDQNYTDRKNDVQNVISSLTKDGTFGKQVSKIGVAGHSLGGYTVVGLAGGWSSWKDSRIDAVLAVSPYVQPFTLNKTLGGIKTPIMYQGADFDLGITPTLEGSDGAYAQSNSPKYFIKLKGGNHFVWTNLECTANKYLTVSACVKSDATAKQINDYAIGFFNKYLKNTGGSVLDKSSGLSSYQHSN